MTIWLAEIRVMLKPSVNDPPGLSIRGGLHSLGFDQVESVRAGKLIQVSLLSPDRESAEAAVEGMCVKLLANPVIEQYSFQVSEVLAPAPAS
jgi:phosphoribosylformylglycinamidine synthase